MSSEQPPKEELCCDHECVCEDLLLYIRSILPEDKCAFMACKDVIRDFKCHHDTRRHPNSTMTLPIQTCNICEIAGACDDEFGADNYPPCVHMAVIEAARKAREDVLDKVIAWKRKHGYWFTVNQISGEKRYHFEPDRFEEFIKELRITTPQSEKKEQPK